MNLNCLCLLTLVAIIHVSAKRNTTEDSVGFNLHNGHVLNVTNNLKEGGEKTGSNKNEEGEKKTGSDSNERGKNGKGNKRKGVQRVKPGKKQRLKEKRIRKEEEARLAENRQQRLEEEFFRKMFVLRYIAKASKRSDIQIPQAHIFVNKTAKAITAKKRRKNAREDRIKYLKHVIGNLDRRGNVTTPGTSEKTDG
uniref:Secreted protein n=1 Tax=Schistosoma mansoni TaxID=6183 RepID=A0A5K4FAU0_SCHMA